MTQRLSETARRTNGTPQHETESATATDDTAALVGNELVLEYSSGGQPVIDGETVTVEPGAVTALVGPNGSGKSTLLRGLADQLEPTAGSVLVDGQAVQSLDQKELAQTLGLLSQESTAPDSITVEQLVYHGRYPHRGFFESVGDADERAVERALERAGCTHLRDQNVSSLSGGQRQLAWIAMVLAQDTDILLLDEPTTFLDLHHQLEVMDIIETLRDESDITIVVVLHDIEQAARLADEMVVLNDGTIHAVGAPSSVVTEGLLADVFRIEAAVEHTTRGPRIEPLSARHEREDGTDAQRGGD